MRFSLTASTLVPVKVSRNGFARMPAFRTVHYDQIANRAVRPSRLANGFRQIRHNRSIRQIRLNPHEPLNRCYRKHPYATNGAVEISRGQSAFRIRPGPVGSR